MKNVSADQVLPTLLIIEQDWAFQNACVEAFKNAFGTTQAFSFLEARSKIEAGAFDAVLLDLKLPDGDGLSLIRHVRESKPHAPIVLIVGDGDAEIDTEAFRAGATDFFNRPYDFQFLTRRLQLLLKLTAQNQAFQTLPKEILAATSAQSSSGLPKMLVVDDESGPAQTIEIIFKDEYEVTLASSADDALNLLQQQTFDIIITDIRMPGMDGIELLNQIRQRNADVPVILNTAYETSDTLLAAIRLQATDYISKPFDVQTIRKAVTQAMQRTKARK
jgi:DNA-binding NtrC family response regulator